MSEVPPNTPVTDQVTVPEPAKPKRQWVKFLIIGLVTLSILSLIAGLLTLGWYRNSLEPVKPGSSTEQIFEVAPGTSPSQIAQDLVSEGLIQNADTFLFYLGQEDVGDQLKAGVYSLSPGLSAAEITEILVSGKTEIQAVLITPGLRLDEIREKFIDAGYESEDVEVAFNQAYEDQPILSELPDGATLEGYLFPDTYFVDYNSSATDLVNRMLANFSNQLTPEIEEGYKKQGLNRHEAITLASIVQKESSDAAVQRQIAQVFLKRLSIDMKLGADPTFLYAAAIDGKRPTVNYDSPYNTRIYPGLPPGPISNFNLSALEAVAEPASGEFLYFVAGDDGVTYFSETFAEHEAKAKQYCIEACKLPQ